MNRRKNSGKYSKVVGVLVVENFELATNVRVCVCVCVCVWPSVPYPEDGGDLSLRKLVITY